LGRPEGKMSRIGACFRGFDLSTFQAVVSATTHGSQLQQVTTFRSSAAAGSAPTCHFIYASSCTLSHCIAATILQRVHVISHDGATLLPLIHSGALSLSSIAKFGAAHARLSRPASLRAPKSDTSAHLSVLDRRVLW